MIIPPCGRLMFTIHSSGNGEALALFTAGGMLAVERRFEGNEDSSHLCDNATLDECRDILVSWLVDGYDFNLWQAEKSVRGYFRDAAGCHNCEATARRLRNRAAHLAKSLASERKAHQEALATIRNLENVHGEESQT